MSTKEQTENLSLPTQVRACEESIGYINLPRTYGKSLIPDPERAPVVQQIFRDFATGRFTKQELLDEMTRRGLKTRKG